MRERHQIIRRKTKRKKRNNERTVLTIYINGVGT
jgi:hypothetical protein